MIIINGWLNARSGSDAAFRELVSRYVDFVYSTALRLMDGDTQLAEDITQTVFLDLARHAGTLSSETFLGGWLHRDTCFVASKVRRSEQRRRAREQEAARISAGQDDSRGGMGQLGSLMDEAINQLGSEDRQAILLRFYEQRDFRSVGAALGSNEDAARMRVKRALEKLQGILKRQGVTVSVAALGAGLASGTVQAAPAGLVASISSAAAASAGASAAFNFLHGLSMANMKLALMAAPVMVAGIAGVLWYQSQSALMEKDKDLERERRKIMRLEAGNTNLPTTSPDHSSESVQRELLRLRGEIGVLRRQLAEAQARRSLPDPETIQLTGPEQKFMTSMLREQYLTRLKINHARNWMLAFRMYVAEHDGQFPRDFFEAARYLPPPQPAAAGSEDDTLLLATNNFEITYSGALTPEANRYVVLMSAPSMNIPNDPSGGWTKIYAFADGSVERVHREDGNFEDWEREHLPPGYGVE